MHIQNLILKEIEDVYDELTPVEKNIADFFLNTKNITDFSAKAIADTLYVSEASLTRFAKKCGYKGFREFIYSLKISVEDAAGNVNEMIQKVTSSYQHILDKIFILSMKHRWKHWPFPSQRANAFSYTGWESPALPPRNLSFV